MLAPNTFIAGLTAGLPSAARVTGSRLPQIKGNERVKLGDFWLQAFQFETRRCGEAATSPPRTVGQTCMVLEVPQREAGQKEAVMVCLGGTEEISANQAAKDKVVFCTPMGETSVFQADRKNRTAALCACGNATGASAAMLAHIGNRRQVNQLVRLPDGQVEVYGGVSRADRGWRVEQSWRGVQFHCRQAELGHRAVVICGGTLNNYIIVRVAGRGELDALSLEEVLDLWNQARQYTPGFDNPLQSRLVAIAPNGGRPHTRFFTCGRMHPGAPLTGLATLALASSQVNWLASLLQRGQIEHARGIDTLPAISVIPGGQEIHFSPIQVMLWPAQLDNSSSAAGQADSFPVKGLREGPWNLTV